MTTSEPDFFDAASVGMQTSEVRQANLRAILTLIALEPGQSAADLARRSRLAPQTVALILADLTSAGLVRHGEPVRGRRGQPATPCFINPTGAFSIGIEIGWQHIEAVLVDIGGEDLAHYRRDYAYPDARTVFTEISGVMRQFLSKLDNDQQRKLVAVGVAAPGGIGRNVGLLNADPLLGRAWQDVDLHAELTKAVGRPVVIFNDGNAACWAELSAHPAPRPSNFAYLHIGTFVSAGIVAQNALWEGPTGNSANLGSMLVNDRHGDQNFVHLVGSLYALERRLEGAGIVVPPTTPLFWPWHDWEPHVSEWLSDAGYALAKAIMNTAAVIEFRTAIVDGILPENVLDRLIDEVRAQIFALPTLTFDRPDVLKGHLRSAAPSRGAAYLPLFKRFFSRDLSHINGE